MKFVMERMSFCVGCGYTSYADSRQPPADFFSFLWMSIGILCEGHANFV